MRALDKAHEVSKWVAHRSRPPAFSALDYWIKLDCATLEQSIERLVDVVLVHAHQCAAGSIQYGPKACVHELKLIVVVTKAPLGVLSELAELPLAGNAPDGFDSQAEWARMVSRVEDSRGAVHAIVHVEPGAVRALCDRFGAQAQVLESEPAVAGRAVVEVRAHRVAALAEQLAGWAAAIEVVGPREVRAALADLGQRLVAQYAEEAHG